MHPGLDQPLAAPAVRARRRDAGQHPVRAAGEQPQACARLGLALGLAAACGGRPPPRCRRPARRRPACRGGDRLGLGHAPGAGQQARRSRRPEGSRRSRRARRRRASRPIWRSRSSRRGTCAGQHQALRRRSARRALAEAVGDAALGQVVGRHLHQHLVAGQHADAVLAHLAGGVGDDLVVVFELHAERRVGQQFADRARKFQKFFFRHSGSLEIKCDPRLYSGRGRGLRGIMTLAPLTIAGHARSPDARADAEAPRDSRGQRVAHLAVGRPASARASRSRQGRILGRPVFDLDRPAAGQLDGPMLRLGRQRDDQVEGVVLEVVEGLRPVADRSTADLGHHRRRRTDRRVGRRRHARRPQLSTIDCGRRTMRLQQRLGHRRAHAVEVAGEQHRAGQGGGVDGMRLSPASAARRSG